MEALRKVEGGIRAGAARKQSSKEALRTSEKRFRALIENSSDAVSLISADGTILYESPAVSRVLGYSPEELIGRNVFELLHPDDLPRIMPIFSQLLQQPHQTVTALARYRHKNGAWLWIEGVGNNLIAEPGVQAIVVNYRDITERKQAEKAVRESEAHLKTILDSALDAIITIDTKGIVIRWNPQAEAIFGWAPAEAVGRKLSELIIPKDSRTAHERGLQHFLTTGEGKMLNTRVEIDGLHRAGHTFPVELTVITVPTTGGLTFTAFVRDVVERRQAEALQVAIYQISEAAIKSSNLDQLFQSVHAIIGRVMPADNFYIALHDPENDLISFPYYMDEVDGSASIPATKPGRGMTEYVLRTGKPLLSDLSNFEELANRGEVELVGPSSPIWMGAPLVVEGRTIGVIALQDYHNPDVYTERELQILEFVSGQVAKAIERTRLYEDIQRNNRILSALQEATLPLIKQTELSEVLQEILKQVTGLFETTDGYIYLVKADESEIILSMGIGASNQYIGSALKMGEGLAGRVWQTRQPLVVEDYNTWQGRAKIFGRLGVHASAAVPLISKSKIIGVLGIGYLTPNRKFSQDDLEMLTRFAELASIAIENARLYTMSQQELAERKMTEEALREAEAKYRTLVEHISAITYTAAFDDEKTRLYVSPQIESLLGYTQAEYLADSGLWKKMLHPNDRERVLAESKRFYETGEPFAVEYRSVARDGRTLWFHDEAIVFEDKTTHKRFIQGVKVDITQRMQAEALQSAMYRISDATSSGISMDEFYRAVQHSLQSVMVADNFFIALYDKTTDLLSFPYYVDENDTTPNTALLGRGPTGYVIRQGKPLLGRSETMQKLEDEGELVPAGTRSMDWLGVPLKINNETIGVMAVQTYTEGIRYTQRDLDILSFVSTQVASSMERRQAYEQIKRQIERLKALRTIDMFIAGGTDLHLTLQTILNQAVSQLGVDAADILLLNTSLHVLEYAEGLGFRTKGIEQSSLRIGEEFAGKAVLEREMVMIHDISSSREIFARQPLLSEEGFTSYYGGPLVAKGEVKGVLETFNRTSLVVDREWTDFFESLAGQAALAIDNASLFDSLQRSNMELGLAYETTLEGWSAALDLRDKETEGHTKRVTDLTLKLAEAMRVSERERVHMRRGALLHDIGKMGIPDRILLKPDQLTEEEWEIMRQHPIYAYNLLSSISHLRPALDIPYCHHEKWDGTGYPRGLKAEAIPLSARIFAVVDVWDALCSDRPYRPAWAKEKALEHIKSLSGSHFDPKVVDMFLRLLDQDDSMSRG